MANGPRSIYSRRQRMAPGQYDTPFADFLDALPGYVNQFQQTQLALGRQQLADKRYEDSIKRQKESDDYNKRKNTFDTNLSIVNQQGPQIVNRYLKTMSKDPKYSEFVTSDIESILSESIKNDDSLNNIEATYSDLTSIGQKELFSKTAELQGFLDTIDKQIKTVGMSSRYYPRLQTKRNAISKIINFNESKEGTLTPSSEWNDIQKSEFKKIEKIRDSSYTKYLTAMSKYNDEFKTKRLSSGKIQHIPHRKTINASGTGIADQSRQGAALFNEMNSYYNNFEKANNNIKDFGKDQNLNYPKSQTREEVKARSELDTEKQKFFNDNAPVLQKMWGSPEVAEGMIDLLSDDNESSDRAYMELKRDLTDYQKYYANVSGVESDIEPEVDTGSSDALNIVKAEESKREEIKKSGSLANEDEGISINRFSWGGQEAIIDYSQTKTIGPTGETAYFVETEDGDQTYVPESSLPEDIASGANDSNDLIKLLDDMKFTAQAKNQPLPPVERPQVEIKSPEEVDILPNQSIDPMFTDQTGLIPVPSYVDNLKKVPPSSIEKIKALNIKDSKGSDIPFDTVGNFSKSIKSMTKRIEEIEKGFFTPDTNEKREQIKIENDLNRLSLSINTLPDNAKNKNLKMAINQVLKDLAKSKKKILQTKRAQRSMRR